jgi:hypothetical protein
MTGSYIETLGLTGGPEVVETLYNMALTAMGSK